MYKGYDTDKFNDILCSKYIDNNIDAKASLTYYKYYDEDLIVEETDKEGKTKYKKEHIYRNFEAGVRLRMCLAKEGKELVVTVTSI